MPQLPDHVRTAVLACFASHNATNLDVVKVKSFAALGDGNWRVRLTYPWAGRLITLVYRYMPATEDRVFPLVRQVTGWHGDKECWGAFCAHCGESH